MFRLVVFDVGQAASAVLRFGRNELAIIDCGLGKGVNHNPLLDFLRRAIAEDAKTTIRFLAISHLDLDHISGLEELLSDSAIASRIERLYCNDLEYRALWEAMRNRLPAGSGVTKGKRRPNVASCRALLTLIKERSAHRRDFHLQLTAPSGEAPDLYPVTVNVAGMSDVTFKLLGPSPDIRRRAQAALERVLSRLDVPLPISGDVGWPDADWNSSSLVLMIEYAGRRFLLPGDATAESWNDILDRCGSADLATDVVVAWHHGARLGVRGHAGLDDLVWSRLRTKPGGTSIAIVSCGRGNPYAHPSNETVAAIKRSDRAVMCTQLARPAETAPADVNAIFPDVGHALDFGSPSDVVLKGPGRDRCCSDISVSISHDGTVQVDTPPEVRPSHGCSPYCCSTHGATRFDLATGSVLDPA